MTSCGGAEDTRTAEPRAAIELDTPEPLPK